MKTHWFILFLLSVAFSSPAVSTTLLNSGPLTVKIMATAQALDNAAVVDKTNSTSAGTTVTMVSKSTVSNSFFASADILGLLENSYNTTFPSGAQLVVSRASDFYQVVVADSTGTNIVLSPGGVCFIGAVGDAQPVRDGSQTTISKTGKSGISLTSNSTETVTDTVVLGYDDSALTTQDGTHTKFEITCLLVRKSSANLATQQIKDSVKLQGVGGGIIRDQNVILQASGSANISGVLLFVP